MKDISDDELMDQFMLRMQVDLGTFETVFDHVKQGVYDLDELIMEMEAMKNDISLYQVELRKRLELGD